MHPVLEELRAEKPSPACGVRKDSLGEKTSEPSLKRFLARQMVVVSGKGVETRDRVHRESRHGGQR